MADVNNKLRLQIVTQLDAAGIKATKDQVDQLELGLRRAGNSGEEAGQKFGALEKALGKLPGPIGQIGSKLGGLAGKATLVFGAFSTGVEIGNKIYSNIVGPLQDWISGTKELEKAEKRYNAELAQQMSLVEAATEAELKRMEMSGEASKKAIKTIDDQTAAYLRQATALSGLKKAGDNAEMIQLERHKFEVMSGLMTEGNPEAAEQYGLYIDVVKEELKIKQQLAEFDRESVKLAKEYASAEKTFANAAERAAEAKADQEAKEAALQRFREKHGINGAAWYDNALDEARDNALEKEDEKAKKIAEAAADTALKRGEKLETVDAAVLQRRMERANIAAAGMLDVDRAAAAYDDYFYAHGNPLNAGIDPSWSQDLLRATVEADNTQREILAEVKKFTDTMQNLLEVK